jgi:hypothetical protein
MLSCAQKIHAPFTVPFRIVDMLSGMWKISTMIVRMDAKRRLAVPADLVPAVAGDHFEVLFDAEEDAVIFRRLPGKEDWLEVLAACPVPMDDLPPRRKEAPKRKHL